MGIMDFLSFSPPSGSYFTFPDAGMFPCYNYHWLDSDNTACHDYALAQCEAAYGTNLATVFSNTKFKGSEGTECDAYCMPLIDGTAANFDCPLPKLHYVHDDTHQIGFDILTNMKLPLQYVAKLYAEIFSTDDPEGELPQEMFSEIGGWDFEAIERVPHRASDAEIERCAQF